MKNGTWTVSRIFVETDNTICHLFAQEIKACKFQITIFILRIKMNFDVVLANGGTFALFPNTYPRLGILCIHCMG